MTLDLMHNGSPAWIERIIAAYPSLLSEGTPRRYTDDELRMMMTDRCEHGNPTTTICDCGSGDMDNIPCEQCT
jgi:hypothetical protein